nr:MDV specific protein - Marek's disease virus [Gallid alphaherpesvirus 2]
MQPRDPLLTNRVEGLALLHTQAHTHFCGDNENREPRPIAPYVLTASDGTTEFSIRDWSLWDRDPESRAGTHRGLRQTERSLFGAMSFGSGRVGFGRLFPSPPPPEAVRTEVEWEGLACRIGGGRGKDVCVIRNRAGPVYVSEFEHALTSCSHRLKPSDRVRAPGQPSVANVWKSLWSLVSRAVRGNAEGSYGRPERETPKLPCKRMLSGRAPGTLVSCETGWTARPLLALAYSASIVKVYVRVRDRVRAVSS